MEAHTVYNVSPTGLYKTFNCRGWLCSSLHITIVGPDYGFTVAHPPELELVVLQSVLVLFELASTLVRVSSMAPPVFNI